MVPTGKVMRSRTGCLTCRARKLKCDEEKPTCTQCVRANRVCRQGPQVTFRHHQNASLNGGPGRGLGGGHGGDDDLGALDSPLKTFYAYKNTFRNDHIWLDIPSKVSFVYVKDPYADLDILDTEELAWSAPPISAHPTATTATAGIYTSAGNALDLSVAEMHTSGPDSPLAAMSPIHRREVRSTTASEKSYNTPPQQILGNGDSSSSRTPHQQTSPAGSLRQAGINGSTGLQTPIRNALDGLEGAAMEIQRSLSGSQDSSTRRWSDEELEVPFLLRHYSEGPGYGMDLFDCGNYFSTQVPIKAVRNPIIMNAACAYAAKHLHRVRGVRAPYGGNCSQRAYMEIWPHKTKNPDWDFYACKYYDRAIKLLLETLHGEPGLSPRGSPQMVPSNTPDELLAATAILCEYEAMDMSDAAWSRHLDGTKSLLEIAELGMRPARDHELLGLDEHSGLFAGSRKAIFWNFARQDFASAFISECPTRLDVTNRKLWIAAGLDLDEHGRLLHSSNPISRYGNDTHSREDMIANSLILILMKLNNFITVGDGASPPRAPIDTSRPPAKRPVPTDVVPPASAFAFSQRELLSEWNRLKDELDTWFANLPDTFQPAARMARPTHFTGSMNTASSSNNNNINTINSHTSHPDSVTSYPNYAHSRYPFTQSSSSFEEVWYPIPMVSSAMQNYHMARILLLINKPHESTARRATVTGRLQSYQAIAAEIRSHAQSIVSIALSRPEAAARIFSIQPLFVAGQCLTDHKERLVVLGLLTAIEKDLGWATEWRVSQLRGEWEIDG